MLQLIRDRARGWVAGVIVGLLSLTFALWGVQHYLHGSGASNTIAKVNGHKINQAELQAAYHQMRQQVQQQFGTSIKVTAQMQKMLREQALRNIINREVLSQAAKDSGFRISPAQIAAVIQQMPVFQVRGQFSNTRYEQVLRAMSYSQENYWLQLEQSLLISQIKMGIVGSAFALPSEIKQAAVLTDQLRDIKYLTIPVKDFRAKVTLSDQQIADYYQSHLKKFTSLPQVSVEYVELLADKIKQDITVSKQEMEDYYTSNEAAFSTPPRWQILRIVESLDEQADDKKLEAAQKKIDSIAQAIKSGKKFETFTDEKPRWVEPSQFTATVISALKSMKEGEISKPMVLNDGFAIVKLVKFEPAKVKPFTSVKEKVKAALVQQALDREFADLTNQMSELAYISADSLAGVADELGLKVHTTALFDRSGGNTPLTKNAKVIAAAFSDEVIHERNNSNMLEVKPGHVMVLRLKQYVPATPKPIATVRDQIVETLKQTKAKELAADTADKLYKSYTAGKGDKALQQAGLTWTTKQKVTRQQPGINAELLSVAFRLPDPSITKQVSVKTHQLSSGDVAMVKVDKVFVDSQLKVSDSQHRVFEKALQRGYGKIEYDLYVLGLMSQASIDIIGQRTSL